jgi:pyridoxal 5'-phosphate synthase pdxT subunit
MTAVLPLDDATLPDWTLEIAETSCDVFRARAGDSAGHSLELSCAGQEEAIERARASAREIERAPGAEFDKSVAEPPRIGVLAIQGDYAAHAEALKECGAIPVQVRKPEQLDGLDGLILPGGESTTMLKFLERHGFFEALREFCGSKPVFGTCAGAILLARQVLNPPQRSLGLLEAVVERNAYGRQIDSAILHSETALPGGLLEMVFIRAPRIAQIGPGVEALAFRDGAPALVRQGSLMAATFHPELSPDRRVHQLFVDAVNASRAKVNNRL